MDIDNQNGIPFTFLKSSSVMRVRVGVAPC